jgi:hypothetical protein
LNSDVRETPVKLLLSFYTYSTTGPLACWRSFVSRKPDSVFSKLIRLLTESYDL